MTGSVANMMACENEQVTGAQNYAGQLAQEVNDYNCMTASTELQSIDMSTAELGCSNYVSQYASFDNEYNCALLAHIAQQTTISTDL